MKTHVHTLKSKSPAEFFAENKNIAGFDNVRYLSLRVSKIERRIQASNIYESHSKVISACGFVCAHQLQQASHSNGSLRIDARSCSDPHLIKPRNVSLTEV